LPNENGETLVACIAITSGFGRIIFGKVKIRYSKKIENVKLNE